MNFKIQNKIPSIRFRGLDEEKKRMKNTKDIVVSKRLIVLLVLVVAIFTVLTSRLAYIQLTQQSLYEVKLEQYGTSIYTRDARRGEITDRNGVKLVENTNVPTAIYYAPKKITKEEIETTANYLVDNITIDSSDITERQKKDFFIIACEKEANALISAEERAVLKEESDTDKKINHLLLERLTDAYMDTYMDENLLKKTKLIYLMQQCTFGSSLLIENLSTEDASKIGANATLLKGVRVVTDWTRNYTENGSEFASVLGKVTTKKQGIPADQKDHLLALDYQNDARIGISGLEAEYEDLLRGTDTKYVLTYDEDGNPIPIYTNMNPGQNGSNLRLSIDWELQAFANEKITNELLAHNKLNGNQYFDRMFFILMDPNNGDVLVMAGKQIDKETGEIIDYATGNYLDANMIGSTTKGGTIYMALKENIISPGQVILDQPLIIKGTKKKASYKNLGAINDTQALAYSSNVYMFHIAIALGGGTYVYDGPLNIKDEAYDTYRKSVGELGLGVKTGLDVANETLGKRGEDPMPGNMLDLAIGQYDTYSNIQLAQYTATLANGGKRVQPRLLLDAYAVDEEGNKITTYEKEMKILDDVSEEEVAIQRVQEGYRGCVTYGLCRSWNNKSYTAYAKTGTAEIFDSNGVDHPNRLVVGWGDDSQGNAQIVFSSVSYRQKTGSSANTVAEAVVDEYYRKYGKK